MAGQDQNNSNQNGIIDNNEIEPTQQSDDENVVEGNDCNICTTLRIVTSIL